MFYLRANARLCFILSLILSSYAKVRDPYATLGLSRDANLQEIKKAYKASAKEWHPDKNSSPEAQDKFVEISEAYKILSDNDRKRLYDTTGQTEEQTNYRRANDHYGHFDPFDDIFGGFGNSGFRFTFREDASNSYAKRAITLKAYESTILPQSKHQPYIILFYSDWCVSCNHVEPIWRRLVEELEPINFGMNTIHAGREMELAKKLGVKNVPYVLMILDGHPYHYTQPSLTVASSLEFIKSKFPHKLVQRVNGENVNEFLGGWMDNKIRVLLFGSLDMIRLRYLTVAWEFRDRAVLGYVQMGRPDSDSLREKYRVSSKVDSMLVFHEDPMTPVATVAMTKLPYQTMKDLIAGNKFLVLPRLSSQTIFDALCPIESIHSRRRLCVVLVTQNNPVHDPGRQALRDYSVGDQFRERDRIRYTYIFREKQAEFVSSLTAGVGSPETSDLHIVILWRMSSKHIRYEWLGERWKEVEGSHNRSKDVLRETVRKLIYTNEPMPFEAEIKELFDEHAQGIIWRIFNRLSVVQDFLRERITPDDVIPVVSVLVTILFILVGGYVMSYLVKLEEDRLKEAGIDTKVPESPSPQLKVHELRGETYCGLIRLLKPGCRTIVLLCDSETKPKLMPKFHKAAWPYRKNKTLMFAHMNMERTSAMNWYKQLLTLGLSTPKELNINPKNTIGTVLALNGHRKYYCIYHAKHPEDLRGIGRSGTTVDFMGFSDTDSESDLEAGDPRKDSISSDKPLLNFYSKILFEEQLLEGFSNWLDRLFEGSTQRYPINFWPDWPGK